jgi:hypothetical protein
LENEEKLQAPYKEQGMWRIGKGNIIMGILVEIEKEIGILSMIDGLDCTHINPEIHS